MVTRSNMTAWVHHQNPHDFVSERKTCVIDSLGCHFASRWKTGFRGQQGSTRDAIGPIVGCRSQDAGTFEALGDRMILPLSHGAHAVWDEVTDVFTWRWTMVDGGSRMQERVVQ